MLNDYVQCVIGYRRFGPFVDMKKEEWCKKVWFDKFGRVCAVFVSLLLLVMNIVVDNRFEICIWDRNSKD